MIELIVAKHLSHAFLFIGGYSLLVREEPQSLVIDFDGEMFAYQIGMSFFNNQQDC